VFASVVWNSVMSFDANRLGCNQQKFASLYFNRFIRPVFYSNAYAVEQLKLHNLCKRRYHLNALFLIQVYVVFKFSPSLLETASLRFAAKYIRELCVLSVCSSSTNCPARHTSAANIVCRDVDMFGTKTVSLTDTRRIHKISSVCKYCRSNAAVIMVRVHSEFVGPFGRHGRNLQTIEPRLPIVLCV
jgi:hypothetical protein